MSERDWEMIEVMYSFEVARGVLGLAVARGYVVVN